MNDYAIVVVPLDPDEGGGYAGIVPDLPGCIGDGDTAAEAIEDTQAAISEWIEASTSLGRSTPKPGSAAKRMKKRDTAMIEAMRAALDFIDQQDGQILDLERKIETLTRLMQDDISLPRKFTGISYSSKKLLPRNQ